MKHKYLIFVLIIAMIAACTGCTSGLGKTAVVEVDALENTEPVETEASEAEEAAPEEAEEVVPEETEEAVPEEAEEEPAAEQTEEDTWRQLKRTDVLPFAESDIFANPEEIDEEYVLPEEAVEEVSPEGRAYTLYPTYLYQTEHSGTVIGAEAPDGETDPNAPSEAELSAGAAVDQAAEFMEKLTGKAPEAGWGVEYWPGEAFSEKAFLDEWPKYRIDVEDDGYTVMFIDAVNGDWQQIRPGTDALSGETICHLIDWGRSEGLDVTMLEDYVEAGRAYAAAHESEAVVQQALQDLGVDVQQVEQRDLRILLPQDGDPEYKARMEEQVQDETFDLYLYLTGYVEVVATTTSGEKIFVQFDTISREIIDISRDLGQEDNKVEIKADPEA